MESSPVVTSSSADVNSTERDNSLGCGPGQPALGGPAWAVGLDKMTSRRPYQAQLVYDAVKAAKVTSWAVMTGCV